MSKKLLSLFTAIFLGTSLFAQDKADIIVKVTKDGAVVKDTTYSFDDMKKAKHAIHLIEAISSDDAHMEMISKDGHQKKKIMFISEDGKVNEIDGHDEMHWVSKEGDCDENIFINEEDGEVTVIMKKIKGDGDQDAMMKKNVYVVKKDLDDEKGTWTVEEGEDGEVIMVSEDGKKIKMIKKEIHSEADEDGKTMKWVSEDNDDVDVVIIKTKDKAEENIKVEVKVVEEEHKEKKKKEKK